MTRAILFVMLLPVLASADTSTIERDRIIWLGAPNMERAQKTVDNQNRAAKLALEISQDSRSLRQKQEFRERAAERLAARYIDRLVVEGEFYWAAAGIRLDPGNALTIQGGAIVRVRANGRVMESKGILVCRDRERYRDKTEDSRVKGYTVSHNSAYLSGPDDKPGDWLFIYMPFDEPVDRIDRQPDLVGVSLARR